MKIEENQNDQTSIQNGRVLCAHRVFLREQWRHVTVPAYIRSEALSFALISEHCVVRKKCLKCVNIHNIMSATTNVYMLYAYCMY